MHGLGEACLCELTYTALEAPDYGSGGQLYGTMKGSLAGDRLHGTLTLTNLAQRGPDEVNVPTLRGVLEGVLDSVGVGGVARGNLFECCPRCSRGRSCQ